VGGGRKEGLRSKHACRKEELSEDRGWWANVGGALETDGFLMPKKPHHRLRVVGELKRKRLVDRGQEHSSGEMRSSAN